MDNTSSFNHESGSPDHHPAYGSSGRPTTEPGQPGSGTGPGTGGNGPTARPGAPFFDTIRSWGVVRPDQGRWAAGVCAGLARHWGMKPNVVRALFVAVSLILGFGLALYGLLWLFLPHPDGRIHAQQVLTGTITAGFVGAVVAVLIDRPFLGVPWAQAPGPWHHGAGLLPLILIGLGAWWLIRHNRNAHPGN
jgi:phage shock protein PspC (stress-responsive transcriptional regulator)